MKINGLIILLILLSSVFPFTIVLGEPYDELRHETDNEHIENALPETISFGNLLPSIGGNEIVVGTSKKTLIVMDSYLKTIFSLNLSSNARKTIIDQIDENLQEKLGLFVLTEDGKIQLYEGYGIRTLSLSFPTGLSDFIVMNADEDSQNEIVLINNTKIEAYDLTGEKIWEYQGEHTFKKLIHSKGFVHLGGIFAHTSNRVYLFSYNGGYIFDVEIGNIRGFLSREDKIFALVSNNQILKLSIENSDSEQIYPNKRNETNFEYISSIYLAGDEFVVTGQRGEFQILNMNGDIVGKGNLKSEIVGSSYNNLDYDKNFNLPYNPYIRNSEIMIATQEGGIYVYSHIFERKNDNDIESQEYYDVNKNIKYAIIFPILEEKPPQRLLIVDAEGRLHSYDIFYFYFSVLHEYNKGVGWYSTKRYQESENSLKKIADEKEQNERIDKNREILKYYGLLEDAEDYLYKTRKELLKLEREGEAEPTPTETPEPTPTETPEPTPTETPEHGWGENQDRPTSENKLEKFVSWLENHPLIRLIFILVAIITFILFIWKISISINKKQLVKFFQKGYRKPDPEFEVKGEFKNEDRDPPVIVVYVKNIGFVAKDISYKIRVPNTIFEVLKSHVYNYKIDVLPRKTMIFFTTEKELRTGDIRQLAIEVRKRTEKDAKLEITIFHSKGELSKAFIISAKNGLINNNE